VSEAAHLLVLNAGSSSIKVQLFEDERSILRGQIDGLGTDPHFTLHDAEGATLADRALSPSEGACHDSALTVIVDWMRRERPDVRAAAIGHRVVHGGPHFGDPVLIDDAVLETLAGLIPLAPLHQPHNLSGIRAARAAFPGRPQVACFDTAFHRGHPRVVDTFALPGHFYDEGVRRYGFHGLSYEYIAGRLTEIAPERGRVIVAHLGNGASMCALSGGKSVSSTMGFSALDGLPMGTRSGQIDPGVLLYLLQEKGMDGDAIADLLYHRSGLKGLSGVSSDMRALEASDAPEAALAVDHFVLRIRREVGALTALLGGLDALVFTGGIGEHSATVRAKVCADMGWLGIALDASANVDHALRLSPEEAAVSVYCIATDEERMIARHTRRLIAA